MWFLLSKDLLFEMFLVFVLCLVFFFFFFFFFVEKLIVLKHALMNISPQLCK